MHKQIAAAVLSLVLAGTCPAGARKAEPLRIDATSTESARGSYEAMMRQRSEAEKRELALAVLVLNMEGVNSVYEVVGNPELQSPSIERIRHKVEGMTAQEIIELSKRNPAVKIEMRDGDG